MTSPPGGTSDALGRPVTQKLGESLGKPIVIDKERFASQGADPVIMTPAQFGAYIKSEYTKWAKVVKDSGARVD